jgi:hypothetical protein
LPPRDSYRANRRRPVPQPFRLLEPAEPGALRSVLNHALAFYMRHVKKSSRFG